MKSKLLLILLFSVIAIVNSFSQQDVNGWYWLTGRPTGNDLHWVKIIDAANIYAVGQRGTFMKSSDGGDTWSVNNQVGSPEDYFGCLATYPLYTGWFFNANTGIVAGQSSSSSPGRVSRTTNGGNTWTYIQYSATGGTVNGMHFINSTTGYMTGNTNAKLYKTTDAGLSWNSISGVAGFPADEFSSVYAVDANNIYLASYTSRKVYNYKTSTGWTTYTLPGPAGLMTDIVFKDANTGYVSGMNNYFAYTTNAGISWNQSNAPSPDPQRSLEYANGVLYMAGDLENIYTSVNNGVTWSSVYFRDNNIFQPPLNSPAIIYGISVNASDIALVGLNGIVNISNDGGASWRNRNYSANNNVTSTTYSSILVQTSGTGLPATGNIWLGPHQGGNILFSSNAGAAWTTKPTPNLASINAIQFVNANTGYVCGGSLVQSIGEMSKTTNGGNSWTALALPTPLNTSEPLTVCFVNASTGWVGSYMGLCFKTTNGGTSWVQQTLPGVNPLHKVLSIQMLDANTGYLLSTSLYKTTNGGTTWVMNMDPYIIYPTLWNSLFLMSKDILYLCGGTTPGTTKKIIRSDDGGTTWKDLSSNLLPGFCAYDTKWINLKHGIVGGTDGLMAKTTNGGLSWSQTNPGGSTIMETAFPNKREWYGVSDRNSAYEAWRKYDNITSVSVNVTMGIEGFMNGSIMTADSVSVELRNSVLPYNKIEQAKELVNRGGYATYEFYNAPAGSYYIVLRHRNSLETWSSVPLAVVSGGNHSYNFTTSASQSFGGNSILKTGVYCVYSGDVNQDQTIDASDLASVENSIDFSGYLPEDLTGDDYVDASDLSIVENNQGISYVTP